MSINQSSQYLRYLNALTKPFKKISKLEFLQPDNSIAFTLDNNYKNGYMTKYPSKAFIQNGTLNISLQNGERRKATITLANLDNAFNYSINNIWFGQKVKLLMGIEFGDGTQFYLPQGVFYIKDPQNIFQHNLKEITFPLVDKWNYLNGTLFGKLPNSYQINSNTNIFEAIQSLLRLSKFNLNEETNPVKQIDNITPVFTNYYNNQFYEAVNSDGSITSNIPMINTPYDIIEQSGGTIANLILSLNEIIAGIIGYDPTGALRVEPSQDDINDSDKAVLWDFNPDNGTLIGLNETIKNSDVYNDVLIIGEGLTSQEVWGRATNFDPRSDTNVNIIGKKTFIESKANYFNATQCVSLAQWYLKRKTVLQKSIVIQSSQMFHLLENRLINVRRIDKKGTPVEKHLIQSISLPIGESGTMSINATSVNDFPETTISTSISS